MALVPITLVRHSGGVLPDWLSLPLLAAAGIMYGWVMSRFYGRHTVFVPPPGGLFQITRRRRPSSPPAVTDASADKGATRFRRYAA